MHLAIALTSSRLFLAPFFFVFFFLPEWTGSDSLVFPALVWILFLVMESSDIADGAVARARNQVSDIGKLLDPFADVLARLTYFICFAQANVMPVWTLMLIFYREFGIMFLRLLMYHKGVALAARRGGKLKSSFYFLAGVGGLFVLTARRLPGLMRFEDAASTVVYWLFVIGATLAVLSFLDYLRIALRTLRNG
ncbi:MAG: CDP-diacylglycerol--glycerol-3-phosphate 3-phosphatidyltransferase [Spirochaetota bacterium]